jgi:hypothetical protein
MLDISEETLHAYYGEHRKRSHCSSQGKYAVGCNVLSLNWPTTALGREHKDRMLEQVRFLGVVGRSGRPVRARCHAERKNKRDRSHYECLFGLRGAVFGPTSYHDARSTS